MNPKCPYCQAVLDMQDDLQGKKVRCPACRGVFTFNTDAGKHITTKKTTIVISLLVCLVVCLSFAVVYLLLNHTPAKSNHSDTQTVENETQKTQDSNKSIVGNGEKSKPSMSDEQYYGYVKAKFDYRGTPIPQQIKLAQSYLTLYPKGKHTGEITALLDCAKSDFEDRARNSCIANLKQLEGAIEQAKLAGINNPTYSDIYGNDKYIRNPSHCPLDETKEYIIESGRPVCPNNGKRHTLQ